MLAEPSTTSSPAEPSRSPTAGPVRNWRSFICVGQPGRNWPPASVCHRPRPSAPPWYSLTAASRARITPATGAIRAGSPLPTRPKAGSPTAASLVASTPWPPASDASDRSWPPSCPKQDGPSALKTVAEPGSGDDTHGGGRIGAAAFQGRHDRRSVDPLPDERQQLGLEDAHPDGPVVHEGAARVVV